MNYALFVEAAAGQRPQLAVIGEMAPATIPYTAGLAGLAAGALQFPAFAACGPASSARADEKVDSCRQFFLAGA
ncbi:hypothetical protein [Rhodopseudomonas sp. RCAM05734]|uniref:hypothetical protein n=1 Tax=Rhodopseudomonas sp. RCAM05734 TaxID=3457549 RepID=UPI004044E674